MLKLCINCKNCVPLSSTGNIQNIHRCKAYIDPVDGGERYTCREARDNPELCGQGAALFDPAEKPNAGVDLIEYQAVRNSQGEFVPDWYKHLNYDEKFWPALIKPKKPNVSAC